MIVGVRALGLWGACVLCLGLSALSACVLYVPTDGFTGGASDAAAGVDASPSADAGSTALAYRELVLSDAPVAYWRLEETEGDVAHDETGHGHDATYVGSFRFAVEGALRGESDKAAEFDGQSAYLIVPDNTAFAFAGTAACSFEAWVKTRPSQNPYRKIFMQAARQPGENPRAGWIFSVPTTANGTGVEYDRLRASNSDTMTAGAVPEQTWTHVVLTYGDATAIIYVNGDPVGSKRLAMTLDRNDANFVIGGNTDPNQPSYSGQMDELAVYDRALTDKQVSAHFRAGHDGAP